MALLITVPLPVTPAPGKVKLFIMTGGGGELAIISVQQFCELAGPIVNVVWPIVASSQIAPNKAITIIFFIVSRNRRSRVVCNWSWRPTLSSLLNARFRGEKDHLNGRFFGRMRNSSDVG